MDKLLFTPGPLTTSAGVKEAMLRDLGSRDGEFVALVASVRERLLALAGVSRETGYEAVPMQGSGTFAVEATLGSVLPPDGQLLVLVNGAYGERMVQIARTLGIETHVLRVPETVALDAAAVARTLEEHPGTTHVAVVHCETTTGILNPVEAICAVARAAGKGTLVDAMSSFGATPIDQAAWGIDFLVSSANKCLEGVPGLAFVLCDRARLEESRGRARSVALDLHAQWRGLEASGQFRFTPPTHAILALARALDELEEEGGIEARGERYHALQAQIAQGMTALGFELLIDPALQGNAITTFRELEHEGFSFQALYDGLSARGCAIYPGKLGAVPCFRIGSAGHLSRDDVLTLLNAVRQVLEELGVPLPAGRS